MAWAFLLVGFMVVVSAYKGTQKDLFQLLKADFSGSDNFFYWVTAIVVLVAIGTFQKIRPVTDAFLALVIIVIVIRQYQSGRDLFGEFVEQVRQGTA